MTAAPIAQTIHDGTGVPREWRRKLIVDWLTANGIRAEDVSANDPITVLAVPHAPADPDDRWLLQVIVFTQYHRTGDGSYDLNLITRRPVTFQRTVPLRVPFPPEPSTDGEEDRGREKKDGEQ